MLFIILIFQGHFSQILRDDATIAVCLFLTSINSDKQLTTIRNSFRIVEIVPNAYSYIRSRTDSWAKNQSSKSFVDIILAKVCFENFLYVDSIYHDYCIDLFYHT